MKVITDEVIVAKRKRMANILAPIAMLLLISGFIINIFSLNDENINPPLFYAMLFLLASGFILSTISSTLVNRWVKEPRADQALSKILRGFDNKHLLFNYTNQAPHILVTPQKIFVITAKNTEGHIRVKNNRWRRKFSFIRLLRFFAEEGLGNPTLEVEHHTQKIRQTLESQLPEILEGDKGLNIEPLIVFTHPNTTLEVGESRVQVLHLGKLKNFIRQHGKGTNLKSELRESLIELLGQTSEAK